MGIEPTKRVLALILAGGRGERLYPLTVSRPKPSVPFGAKHRIVDFVLSNCINSGVQSIYVLVQYMSQSLIEYLRSSWRTVGLTRDQFIALVPPQMRLGGSIPIIFIRIRFSLLIAGRQRLNRF